ncbi:hypothetical protein [Chitinophaga silvatica]|uniref:hypothetical protein n=1 Tax=Chitinophaga silvatica TaxID=2282649 RepID=UPI001314F4CA|nr:hypothetical protein [Chitinophaga silvatica]
MFLSKKEKKKTRKEKDITLCKSMKDFSEEEYFVKKLEKAKESLNKWGLPKELPTNNK